MGDYSKGGGSPEMRGSWDSYYGRTPRPHKWMDPLGRQQVELTDRDEIDAYWRGYNGEMERKEW
jgi:hypothetical protein